MRRTRTPTTCIWARLTGNTFQDTDGATQCRVVLSDITDRMNMETELQKLAEEQDTSIVRRIEMEFSDIIDV
jgi:hypothetical protein